MNYRDYQQKRQAQSPNADPDKMAKVLERIRKLLAMSKGNSNPHEAGIAARRARALMDEYQVTEMDLTQVAPKDFGTADASLNTRNQVFEVSVLAMSIAELNDCIIEGDRNLDNTILYRFKGLLADAVCATEMFKWLRDDMYRYAALMAEGRQSRKAYRLGFAKGIQDQVRNIMRERGELKERTHGTSLVLVKAQLVTEHFGEQRCGRTRSATASDSHAYHAGYTKGHETNLSKQVEGESQRRLNQ